MIHKTNGANMFQVGEVFPPQAHYQRVLRCKQNKLLFKGFHTEVFHNNNSLLPNRAKDSLYISVNLASIICKKSADFLFGESVKVYSGVGDHSNEQKAFDRMMEQNHLGILLYESALSNAFAGDAFIKVRYGQEYGGDLPKELDEHRVIIENLSAENVYPETVVWDKNRIKTYHVAVPYYDEDAEQWFLNVESHSSGEIRYHQYTLTPLYYNALGECERWSIDGLVEGSNHVVKTGVAMPLVVHIPNLATADEWEGIDDITELHPLFDEINNRLSQIADILDKHANPALALPSGLLGMDENGNPQFNVAIDKVFEVMGKDDILPQYITWNGQLNEAFTELDKLIDLVLTTAEIPAVVLGRGDSGTSGASGLSIKFRMNSLLAKINRKRQYYEKGLKQIFYVAQKLEEAVGITDYEITIPVIEFNDGLPIDEMQQATIAQIRTGGAVTLSQKSAIMKLNNMTEEQAEAEIERIKAEQGASQPVAEPSMFNEVGGVDLSMIEELMEKESEVEIESDNNSPEEDVIDLENERAELEALKKMTGK